jgi:hypothetical protein
MNTGSSTVGEYRTAHGNSVKELDAEVNELIKEGFQPYGSPYVSDRPFEADRFGVWQAMVRDKSHFVAD